MKAIIYRPTKSAMQSGLKKTKYWVLKSEDKDKYIEPFMGWTGSNNMDQEICIKFETKEKAVAFAKAKSWDYEVIEPQTRKTEPKSYLNNFK